MQIDTSKCLRDGSAIHIRLPIKLNDRKVQSRFILSLAFFNTEPYIDFSDRFFSEDFDKDTPEYIKKMFDEFIEDPFFEIELEKRILKYDDEKYRIEREE